MKKKIIIIASVVVVIIAVVITLVILQSQGKFAKGNAEQYSVSQTQINENSPIKGKTIIFLGSSVTVGSTAKNESFVDFLERVDGIVPIKEAVSSTTLVDNGSDSYVARIKTIDKNAPADMLICQLSTNDAKKKKPLGAVSDSFDIDSFDTKTVAGAIEYIIAYSKQTWDCPVAFYTGTKYNSKQYSKMVELLYEISEKWEIDVIDLWNDEEMNAVSKQDYSLYMVNGIHPSQAGYKLWWTPKFEEYLYQKLTQE